MKPIRVMTSNFELLTEIDQYQSAIEEVSFHGIGQLNLVINRYMQDASLLQRGVLLFLDTDNAYIIKSREIQLTEDGKASENWSITALSLKSIFRQRITEPPTSQAYDRITDNAETVMKHYVEQNVVNPSDTDRIIPNVTIAPNQNRGDSLTWQSRYKVLSDELEEISLATGLGWELTLDIENQQWVFDVVEGENRTTQQSIVPPVIFSPEFESVREMIYSENEIDYRNVAIVGGQGEGVDREIVEVGTATGLDRHEVFVDARDIENSSDLTERGEVALVERSQDFFLEAQIMTPVTRSYSTEEFETMVNPYQPVYQTQVEQKVISTFEYKRDFFNGDLVTIRNKEWGVTLHTRITKIREIHEPNGYQIEAVFGQDQPTLTDKLKQKFSEYDHEIKR